MSLFIKDDAGKLLEHDIFAYMEDCHQRYPLFENRLIYDRHARRFLDFMGFNVGPFCGYFT